MHLRFFSLETLHINDAFNEEKSYQYGHTTEHKYILTSTMIFKDLYMIEKHQIKKKKKSVQLVHDGY